jgi:hypothetical protein
VLACRWLDSRATIATDGRAARTCRLQSSNRHVPCRRAGRGGRAAAPAPAAAGPWRSPAAARRGRGEGEANRKRMGPLMNLRSCSFPGLVGRRIERWWTSADLASVAEVGLLRHTQQQPHNAPAPLLAVAFQPLPPPQLAAGLPVPSQGVPDVPPRKQKQRSPGFQLP